jgi:hypothetical protein
MASATGTDRRQSGTGQDTPKVCVHVPPRTPLRPSGHGGTLSRPAPLSRSGHSEWWSRVPPGWLATEILNDYGGSPKRPISALVTKGWANE